jgi:small subunit ribosomal protein S16
MPVKIRLTRMGKKKQPSYRVVVVDSRKPRDGAYLEQIGRYDPRAEPSIVEIDNERALDWLQKGAQPTERAKKLLEISGAWTRFAIDRGEIHTVGGSEPEASPEPAREVAPEPEPEVAPEPEPEPVAADDADSSEEEAAAEDEASPDEAADNEAADNTEKVDE